MRKIAIAAASLAAYIGAASAQEPPTVTSLLAEGYAVVSTFMSPIGPGIFLQKAEKLFLCFVEETRQTAELRTLYCKPVI